MSDTKIVVLADDDEDDRLFLSEALLNAEPELSIVEAKSGVELIKIFEKEAVAETPDLIVIDMNMPYMDGMETLKALRKIPNVDKVPVVMLSTASYKVMAQSAIKGGFEDYFVKPHHILEYVKLATTLRDTYLR